MTDKEGKDLMSFIGWVVAFIAFGVWQESIAAGFFVAGALCVLSTD